MTYSVFFLRLHQLWHGCPPLADFQLDFMLHISRTMCIPTRIRIRIRIAVLVVPGFSEVNDASPGHAFEQKKQDSLSNKWTMAVAYGFSPPKSLQYFHFEVKKNNTSPEKKRSEENNKMKTSIMSKFCIPGNMSPLVSGAVTSSRPPPSISLFLRTKKMFIDPTSVTWWSSPNNHKI